jgi:pilus assembly protein CpaB
MKGRTFFMFVIALVLGVSAAWLANNWVEERTRPGADTAGTPVVVAALDIPFGQKIEQAHVKVVEWPSGNTPKGAFSDPLLLEGRIAKQSFLPGEVILEERVVEHLGGSTLASIVEPNKRAVTVRVNDVIGVAGFLLPGNRVDILSTKSKGRDNAVTETILQDVKVLAVDQTASTDKDRPVVVRAVTLELSPAEAELLVKATNEGTLQLTLRNPLDSELVAKKEEEVKKAPPPAEVKKVERVVYRQAPSNKTNITVIRGTRTETVSVKNEPTVIKK